ncbi:MAG: hypothetical protein ACRDPW_02010 [Mycobacteriales bacterium]
MAGTAETSGVWTWRYFGAERTPAQPALDDEDSVQEFPSQSDAESWLGEHWRDLAAAGVTEVELIESEKVHYAMSLAAADS